MSVRAAYDPGDGTVRVVCPSPEAVASLRRQGLTLDAARRVIFRRAIELGGVSPDEVAWREFDDSDGRLSDRAFRDAWEYDAQLAVRVSMPRARSLHLRRIREHRQVLLDELDRDWMRAVGQGDDRLANEIEARRQTLRDVPVVIAGDLDAALTTGELRRVWHASLGDNPWEPA